MEIPATITRRLLVRQRKQPLKIEPVIDVNAKEAVIAAFNRFV
jgi:hypothetical protein